MVFFLKVSIEAQASPHIKLVKTEQNNAILTKALGDKLLKRYLLGFWVMRGQKSHNPLLLHFKNKFYRSVSCCEGKKMVQFCSRRTTDSDTETFSHTGDETRGGV